MIGLTCILREWGYGQKLVKIYKIKKYIIKIYNPYAIIWKKHGEATNRHDTQIKF